MASLVPQNDETPAFLSGGLTLSKKDAIDADLRNKKGVSRASIASGSASSLEEIAKANSRNRTSASKKRKKKQKKPPKHPVLNKVINWVLLIVAIGSMGVAGFFFISNAREAEAYNDLSDLAHLSGNGLMGDGEQQPVDNSGINWDELRAVNDHTAAWMNIANTPIDYAVVQAWPEEPDYWLHHDFWWNPGWVGVPFIDARTHANAQYVLTYAHHLGDTDMMFTPLYKCYEQWRLDEIGDMTWSTPEQGSITLKPLFSKIVNMEDQPTQTFDWRPEGVPADEDIKNITRDQMDALMIQARAIDTAQLSEAKAEKLDKAINSALDVSLDKKSSQALMDKSYKNLVDAMTDVNFNVWLLNLGADATAQKEGWQEIAKNASRVITCVTCARSYTGLPDRTIVVFAV